MVKTYKSSNTAVTYLLDLGCSSCCLGQIPLKNVYFGPRNLNQLFFFAQVKRLPGEILKALNVPVPTYSDSYSDSAYSVMNVVKSVFGVDIFTLTFIAGLYFLASLALVSIVLPNLYFRLMLWADVTEAEANIYDDDADYLY